ncbi:ribosome maturation factor RimM [Helicobacter sp. MIT 99-5507]|uniref:ribosome maturation factor RimM n=1 Tax=Helicobacter sp. MIT 99-5507 TaxID=152489 RepID=UPI000E1ECED3|nr:ribosome maturation factor RimM [Helicobacter sp. MIT 99-5507]RDU57440.1 16S rRNA processing protein RimM [Helicobacter sp. MIT 99-5507]
MDFDILVAKCGKSIGLKGHLKLIIYTDFIDIFKPNNIFLCKNTFLTIEHFNPHQNSIKFLEINTIDEAKALTSYELYTTKDTTLKICKLDSDEFFWFDIVGLNIIDNGILLGIVENIERVGNMDYLIIKTNMDKFSKPHSFMIPYIDRYIINVDLDKKIIYTRDAILILETS